MERPDKLPQWASDVTALKNEPTVAKKGTGWTTSTGDTSGIPEKPSLQAFNYWMNNVYENIKYLAEKTKFDLGTPRELVSNTLLPVVGGHIIVGEGNASDDLEYIDRSAVVDGDNIILMNGDLVNPITIKHAAVGTEDRIFLASKEDYVLDTNNKYIVLKRIGTDFYEVLRAYPGNTDFNPSNTLTYNLGSDARKWFNAFIDTLKSNNIDTPDTNGTLDIGGTEAQTINIGRTGATVAMFGDIFQVVATETVFTDKLLVLNSGGLPASADGTGFSIEEDGLETGYMKTSADRQSFLIKPPAGDEFEFNSKSFATIGDTKFSVLTLAQFQNINGTAWTLADGSEVSRTTYADLYALVGDTYGAGDGSTTFNLPDLREKYMRGTAAAEAGLGTSLDDSTAVKGLTIDVAGGSTAISASTNNAGAQNINASTSGAGAQNINASTSVNSSGGSLTIASPLSTDTSLSPVNINSGNRLRIANVNTSSTINAWATNTGGLYNASVNVSGGSANATTNVNNVSNHNHTITVNNVANHSHTVSGNVDTAHNHTLQGDSETRPKSVVLNCFIKIV